MSLANLLVQFAILAVLIWYALETLRIRRASQEQAEAQQRPCLTLVTASREHGEAVLDMNGIVGGMIVAPREGNVALQNMGNGPAVNVRYEFNPVNPPQGANVARPRGYLQNIPAGGTFVMAVAREVLRNLEYEFVTSYESLNGQNYESRIAINNLVLTNFHFGKSEHDRMSPAARLSIGLPARLADAFYRNMRKLAREAVIFCLLGALVTGVVEFVIQRGRIVTTGGIIDLSAGFVPPIELCVKFLSIPKGYFLDKPCVMDEKIIEGFSSSMCLGVLGDDGKCSRLSPEGEAAEARAKSIVFHETQRKLSWKDIPGILGASVGFAFMLGFPGGLALWIFYRLVRFAIVG